MVDAVGIVNRSAYLAGNRDALVTGVAPTFDDSTIGKAAQQLYPEAVNLTARAFEWDFARSQVALTAAAGTPPDPWTNQYLYPANGIQVWQVRPATLTDPFNPAPVNWVPGNALVSGTQTKVIWCNIAGALAVYNNNPGPELWDPGFTDAVVRTLAAGFLMALAGRPESMVAMQQAANAVGEMAKGRDG